MTSENEILEYLQIANYYGMRQSIKLAETLIGYVRQGFAVVPSDVGFDLYADCGGESLCVGCYVTEDLAEGGC